MILLAAVCAFVLGAAGEPAKPEITFRGLGDLPDGAFESRALGVSGDGKTVVGTGFSKFGVEGFLWTEKDGMIGIGVLRFPIHISAATAISHDGTVVAGYSHDEKGRVAITWTRDGGLVSLGRPAGTITTAANAVSEGGRMLVGFAGVPQVGLDSSFREIQLDEAGKFVALDKMSNPHSVLANQVGLIRALGSQPTTFDGGVPSIDFYLGSGRQPGLKQSVVTFTVGGTKTTSVPLDGPMEDICGIALRSVSLTGVSRNGGVVCGTIDTWHYKRQGTFGLVFSFAETISSEGFYTFGGEIYRLEGVLDDGLKLGEKPGVYPTAISANGSTIVGYVVTKDRKVYARIWKVGPNPLDSGGSAVGPEPSEDDVAEPISGVETLLEMGRLPFPKRLWAVSADGRVVGGEAPGRIATQEACLWNQRSKLVLLTEYLQRHCPKDVKGWALSCVKGISADGRTVVGYGKNPKGKTEAWIATVGNVQRPYKELFPSKEKRGEDDPGDEE